MDEYRRNRGEDAERCIYTLAGSSDYQVTARSTKTKQTRGCNDGRISLGIYYDFSITTYVAPNVLRSSLLQTLLAPSTVSWLSRVSWRSRLLWKEAVISLTVTRLERESAKRRREGGRERERESATRGTPGRGCEGIQFPSSRGWRAAHTLPFGAVTPRELWSPNEWLGRAKRRITYFFFFFFFARSRALFQDVYKYENRTCLPTSPQLVAGDGGDLSLTRALRMLFRRASHRARTYTGRSAARGQSISLHLRIAQPGGAYYETYLSECVFYCPINSRLSVFEYF